MESVTRGIGCSSPGDLLPLQSAAPSRGLLLVKEMVAAKCKIAIDALESSENSTCK